MFGRVKFISDHNRNMFKIGFIKKNRNQVAQEKARGENFIFNQLSNAKVGQQRLVSLQNRTGTVKITRHNINKI